MAKFLVLSIDGGGIRGAFAARLIELLARDFDLIPKIRLLAGTSTGSIIAACLALKFPPSRIIALYKASSKSIFTKQFFLGPRILEKALKSSYDKLRFKAILSQVYGKARLENAKIPLMLPTTHLQNAGPYLVKSYDAESKDLMLYEAVLASCAAPTYFDPSQIHGMLLADGGMWSNNPSLVALAEAKRHFKIPDPEIMLLSIGTGHFTNGFDEDTKYWGLMSGWKMRTLTEFISSLQSQSIYEISRRIIEPDNILRLNFSQDELIPIDDFSQLDKLIAKADVIYKKNKEQIRTFMARHDHS